ncbi:hypothetical protein RUM44_001543 [Polyplax serrata]|uniref:Uncharacterized protein n=1 Tax=Polyplax serrata TaxID=468196 RepID=A0ABR1AKE5_POLSC
MIRGDSGRLSDVKKCNSSEVSASVLKSEILWRLRGRRRRRKKKMADRSRVSLEGIRPRQSIDQKGQTSNRKTISKPDRSDLVTIGVKLVFYSTTGNKAPVNADLFVESSNLRKRPGEGTIDRSLYVFLFLQLHAREFKTVGLIRQFDVSQSARADSPAQQENRAVGCRNQACDEFILCPPPGVVCEGLGSVDFSRDEARPELFQVQLHNFVIPKIVDDLSAYPLISFSVRWYLKGPEVTLNRDRKQLKKPRVELRRNGNLISPAKMAG